MRNELLRILKADKLATEQRRLQLFSIRRVTLNFRVARMVQRRRAIKE